jgi:hypothetical protein
MAVVKSTCEGRNITYTWVSEGGEIRDCARCMGDVFVNPEKNTFEHLD